MLIGQKKNNRNRTKYAITRKVLNYRDRNDDEAQVAPTECE